MKKQVKLALAGAAVGVVSLVAMTQSAVAQGPASFAVSAEGISDGTESARAMDQCSPSTVTVLTPGSPAAGCIQSNGSETDNTVGMTSLHLQVTQRGRIVLFGRGFKLGDELRLRLTLRVTKKVDTQAQGSQSVTFPDVTVDCPAAPDAFNARPNGALIGTTTLAQCLAPEPGLVGSNANIEILDASLVNVLNDKIVAVPGIRR